MNSLSRSSAAPDALSYPSHALAVPELRAACAELPPAWTALLAPIFGGDAELEIRHIATGGSDRSFYRIRGGERSVVMCVTPKRDEFQNYIAIGLFLRGHGLPLPEIQCWSDTTGLAVLQDAGTTALQDVVLRHGPASEETFAAYARVLRTLGRLQATGVETCSAMASRPFGMTDLRWETEYFRENFLGRHLGWDLSGDEALTADFERLAERVLAEPLYPMHRDFQSQNVFIDAEQVWILDFQGARTGPLCYDVASLVRDPYACLPAEVEERLLRYYFENAIPAGTPYATWEAFRGTYGLVSLQRLMQALGAYGFLTLVKGKPWFQKWITPALHLLSRAVAEVPEFERLRQVVAEASERQEA